MEYVKVNLHLHVQNSVELKLKADNRDAFCTNHGRQPTGGIVHVHLTHKEILQLFRSTLRPLGLVNEESKSHTFWSKAGLFGPIVIIALHRAGVHAYSALDMDKGIAEPVLLLREA